MSRLMKGSKSTGTWFFYGNRATRACEACVFGRGPHMKNCPAANRPNPAPFIASAETVHEGDTIELTTMGAPWTRGLRFHVDMLASWGVLCSPLRADVKLGEYRARWSEILRVVKF